MAVQMQADTTPQGLRSFGLTRPFDDDTILDEGENDSLESEESDEPEEVDASEEDQEIIDEDPDEDESIEAEEEDLSPKEKKLLARAKKAEELTRTFQSTADKERAEREKLESRLDERLSEIQKSIQVKNEDLESDEFIDELDDDALIYGKDLKKIVSEATKKPTKEAEEVEAKTKEFMSNLTAQENRRQEFLNSQSDITEVRDYISKNQKTLENDPLMRGASTDSMGIYFFARMKIAESKLKKTGKKRMTPIGGGASRERSSGDTGKSRLERQFEGTFKDRGLA